MPKNCRTKFGLDFIISIRLIVWFNSHLPGNQAQFVRIALAFGLTVRTQHCHPVCPSFHCHPPSYFILFIDMIPLSYQFIPCPEGCDPRPDYWTCVWLPCQPCRHCRTDHRSKGWLRRSPKKQFHTRFFRLVSWRASATLWCKPLGPLQGLAFSMLSCLLGYDHTTTAIIHWQY